jgi:UDP-2-acetamido-2,6-beta-L-arabino-hexul-4-ose reductase
MPAISKLSAIAVSGSSGFIAKNLILRLRERGYENLHCISHFATDEELARELRDAAFLFHLAGVNRPQEPRDFRSGNVEFTERICNTLAQGSRSGVFFSSSIQAEADNAYGRSKLAAENVLRQYGVDTGAQVHIARLPNVFGKWSRPNYNSAVATFCYNASRGLPLIVNDPDAAVRLLYIDDLVDTLIQSVEGKELQPDHKIGPVYSTTVGHLAETIQTFSKANQTLAIDRVGIGLARALYATYVSFLPPEKFSYKVPMYRDSRGAFVEMLKTLDSGQFSYFTAGPKVVRGEHYHHSKTEKFLVIAGKARFAFRNIDSGERHELFTSGGDATIVETIPGWAHNIENVGEEELVVMLWANEVFDRERPDTIARKVSE